MKILNFIFGETLLDKTNNDRSRSRVIRKFTVFPIRCEYKTTEWVLFSYVYKFIGTDPFDFFGTTVFYMSENQYTIHKLLN